MRLMDLGPKLAYHASHIIRIEVKRSQIWESPGGGSRLSRKVGQIHFHTAREREHELAYKLPVNL
jgi:hypothetical protein